MSQLIRFTPSPAAELDSLLGKLNPDRVFVLTDTTTHALCLPLLKECAALHDAPCITIEAGDVHKHLGSLTSVWSALCDGRATRHSLLVNLGGGMVTDLGGFAAATFKRGIRFINVPTTLLGMVDAAVGGKTGINFNGLKNEIGAFREADAVVVSTAFLRTLDSGNLRSGYAEMLKHSLLENREVWSAHLKFNLGNPDLATLQELVRLSIEVKTRIVTEDPCEKGIRKALNLGHTAGHALESLALEKEKPVLHGFAVAWGIVCELFISCAEAGFPEEVMRQTVGFIRETYGVPNITCKDYDRLYALMLHDKKNVGNDIRFTLLSDIGTLRLDSLVPQSLVFESFDFLREG